MLQIITADKFRVVVETIGIIGVVAQKWVPPRFLFGDHLAAQSAATKHIVAYKINGRDNGLAIFGNHKSKVHAIFWQANELRSYANIIKALGLIKRQNAACIALHAGFGVNHALFNIDLFQKSVVVNFTVAFKIDQID